jgi:hypothetical protein
MAWAQRSEPAGYAVDESQRFVYRGSRLRQAERCAGCTSLIVDDGILVDRERYCSAECVLEATRAKYVPGHYLG